MYESNLRISNGDNFYQGILEELAKGLSGSFFPEYKNVTTILKVWTFVNTIPVFGKGKCGN